MIRVPVTAAMVFVLLASGRVQAAVFPCPSGDVTCLIVAINTANGNGEDDTIQLEAGTYTLTAVDNETDGPNGLPSITSTLTIRGAAADTTIIAREASAPPFRILHVAAAGSLALEGLAIRGGLIHADFNGDPIPGGCGLRNLGAVTITDSTITGNLASVAEGGGLFNVGTMAITDSTIAGNGAEDGRGGAGIVSSGTMTIANSTIAGNGAVATNLGGIGNSGTLTITNSTIARNSGEVFGGISNSGTLTITDSTIADNRAHFRIAGIDNSGTLTITNSTIANNDARVEGGGIDNSGTLTITNSTIANNDAGIEGGGIVNRGEGTVELHNTILAKNRDDQREQPSDCSGPVTSLGNNLIGDTAGCTITLRASDLTGEPGLGAFTDDGTPGHGHFPLLPASRAINAGQAGRSVLALVDELLQHRLVQPLEG